MLLGNPAVMHEMRLTRRVAALVACILSAALIGGCTSDSEGAEGGKPSKGSGVGASPSAASDQAKLQEKQVEDALGIGEEDDTGELFVESRLERVSDGIHADAVLSEGGAYTLAVVCSGAGRVRLEVSGERPEPRTVACDGVSVRQRITDAPARIEIDVDGLAGSSGIVGWRIDELGT